ncbi:MAG: hypothetical protein ACKO6N_06710 [Myxococcota bacterium]
MAAIGPEPALELDLGTVPSDSRVLNVYQELVEHLALEPPQGLGASAQYKLVSLLIGVQAPDTFGGTSMDLPNLVFVHVQSAQTPHALREPGDHGREGRDASIERSKEYLEESVRQIRVLLKSNPEHSIDVDFSLDQYGTIQLPVLEVWYLTGKALHLIQDSYSHTVRDENLKVIEVTNFVDAQRISERSGKYDPEHYGHRHRKEADDCSMSPLYALAINASSELLEVLFLQDSDEAAELAWNMLALRHFQPSEQLGCSDENDFCGSPYASYFDKETEPLGCSLVSNAPGHTSRTPKVGSSALLLLCCSCLVFYRRARAYSVLLTGILISTSQVAQASEAPLQTDATSAPGANFAPESVQATTPTWAFRFEPTATYLDGGRISVGAQLNARVLTPLHVGCLRVSGVLGWSPWLQTTLQQGPVLGDLIAGAGIHRSWLPRAESSLTLGPAWLLFDTAFHKGGDLGVFVNVVPLQINRECKRLGGSVGVIPLRVTAHNWPGYPGLLRWEVGSGISLKWDAPLAALFPLKRKKG